MLDVEIEVDKKEFTFYSLEGINNKNFEELEIIHELTWESDAMDIDLQNVSDLSKKYYIKADFTDDAILGYTKEFTIMYWGKETEKLLGYTKQEVIGKQIDIIVPENKHNELQTMIDKLEQDKTIKSFETIRKHKNGSLIPVGISVTPLLNYDGKFFGVFEQYRDLTERMSLLKQLETAEELLRSALQGGKFGVWEWRIDTGFFIFHNDWYQLLGLDDPWKNKKTFDEWSKIIHEDDFPLLREMLMNAMGGQEYVFEFRMLRVNGEHIWVRGKGKVTQWDSEGKSVKMIGTFEDITDRRLIREQLTEKCRQLEISKKEAEQANIAKTKFLSGISHEIRTPMNGILGSIQLLFKTKLEPKQLKWMNTLKESVDNQMSIINNMLDITRIESGKIDLDNTVATLSA